MRQGHSILSRIMKLTISICIKYNVYRKRGMTSLYHGGKIFVSQQSFLLETAVCIVER